MNDHEVDKSMCAVFGCPCVGTTSTSASGGGTWYCSHHLGTDAVAWPRITLELKRLEWLLTVCRGIRAWHGTHRWERVYRAIQRDIVQNQRSDLLFDAQLDQTVSRWLVRLETVISRCARGAAQPQLPVTPQQPAAHDPMQRVQFDVPQHA